MNIPMPLCKTQEEVLIKEHYITRNLEAASRTVVLTCMVINTEWDSVRESNPCWKYHAKNPRYGDFWFYDKDILINITQGIDYQEQEEHISTLEQEPGIPHWIDDYTGQPYYFRNSIERSLAQPWEKAICYIYDLDQWQKFEGGRWNNLYILL